VDSTNLTAEEAAETIIKKVRAVLDEDAREVKKER
jgi:hypothetical protein